MGTNSLNNIKRLIKSLPTKDIKFAENFIENRDFESLRELVDSAIKRINKSLTSTNPKEEYLNLDMDSLESLLAEVIVYASYLDISEFDNDEEGQFYEDMCNMCEEW